MYRCPFPGCNHIGQYAITNIHAATHGFKTVREMTSAHGKVTMVSYDTKKLNRAHKQPTINHHSFNNLENAMSRLKKTDRSDLKTR